MEVLQIKKKQKHMVKKLTLLIRSPPIRCGRSGTCSGSVRVYSGFGFLGSKISVPFGYF